MVVVREVEVWPGMWAEVEVDVVLVVERDVQWQERTSKTRVGSQKGDDTAGATELRAEWVQGGAYLYENGRLGVCDGEKQNQVR